MNKKKLYEIKYYGSDAHTQVELTDEEVEGIIRFAKISNSICRLDSEYPCICITYNGEKII